jgi:hypothetical protein
MHDAETNASSPMDTEQRFEQLKAKFAPALQFLESGKISLQALNIQDDRLLVRVVVPSAEVRDQVVEQFKRLDPSLAEVHPDIRIEAADNVPATGQSTVQTGGSFSNPGEPQVE